MQEFIFQTSGKDPLFSEDKKSIYQDEVNYEAQNRGLDSAVKLEALRQKYTEPERVPSSKEIERAKWESQTYHLLVRDSKSEPTITDIHYQIAQTIQNIELSYFATPFVQNLRHIIPDIENQLYELENEIKLLFTNVYQHLINPSLGLVKNTHNLHSHHSKLGFFELIKQIIAGNINKYKDSIHSIQGLRTYLRLPNLHREIIHAFEHLHLGQAIDSIHQKFESMMQDYFVLPFLRLQEVSVVTAKHW